MLLDARLAATRRNDSTFCNHDGQLHASLFRIDIQIPADLPLCTISLLKPLVRLLEMVAIELIGYQSAPAL